MKKHLMILLSLIAIILGGCQMGKDKLPSEMNPKDLPDGRAFEDEFTRGLLQSTEEVMPGYYPFLAQNGKWEMAFPKEGLAGERSYTTKDNFESISFTDWEEGKNTSAMVDVEFYSSFNPGHIESKKDSLQSNLELSLTFEEISRDSQTYYIAPFEKKLNGKTNIEKYGLAAYIQRENDAGGIYVRYSIYCEADCEAVKDAELAEAYDWIQTIQFVNESQGEIK